MTIIPPNFAEQNQLYYTIFAFLDKMFVSFSDENVTMTEF